MNLEDKDPAHEATTLRIDQPGARIPPLVPIRAIGAGYRPQICIHLLALNERDRYLRFGYVATDSQVRQYVDSIDFHRDQAFGIFNRKLELIAFTHLAYPPEPRESNTAEFGVSVQQSARGHGYGAVLFERAAISAINDGIDTLIIYALSENGAMLHIAREAGATIENMGSESEACVRLPKASLFTRLNQYLANQLSDVDYWLKKQGTSLGEVLEEMEKSERGADDAT